MKSIADLPPLSHSGNRFLHQWHENIVSSGCKPTKGVIGFVASWLAFFLILFAMPLPTGNFQHDDSARALHLQELEDAEPDHPGPDDQGAVS